MRFPQKSQPKTNRLRDFPSTLTMIVPSNTTLQLRADWTYFIDLEKFKPYLSADWAKYKSPDGDKADESLWKFFERTGSVETKLCLKKEAPVDDKQIPSVDGRGLVASSHAGKYLSITLRYSGEAKKPEGDIPLAPHFTNPKSDHVRGYLPPNVRERGDFGFSIAELSYALKEVLFPDEAALTRSGIVVIAAETSAGKSQIQRGLTYLYLKARLKNRKLKDRNLHLLTLENPIEEPLFYEGEDWPEENETSEKRPISPIDIQKYYHIDYTARQMPRDTPGLQQALMKDALRQTPALVFIGEVRDEAEWKTVLQFAETGHLVITTTHASSVRETMQRIASAIKVKNPAEYGEVGQRMVAIVHLRNMKALLRGGAEKGCTLPSVWMGTTAGVAALQADGPSSVLPFNFRDLATGHGVGRLRFLRKMASGFSPVDKGPLRRTTVTRNGGKQVTKICTVHHNEIALLREVTGRTMPTIATNETVKQEFSDMAYVRASEMDLEIFAGRESVRKSEQLPLDFDTNDQDIKQAVLRL